MIRIVGSKFNSIYPTCGKFKINIARNYFNFRLSIIFNL